MSYPQTTFSISSLMGDRRHFAAISFETIVIRPQKLVDCAGSTLLIWPFKSANRRDVEFHRLEARPQNSVRYKLENTHNIHRMVNESTTGPLEVQ
jgi:hypothetical protein